jgi:hypothetical protein
MLREMFTLVVDRIPTPYYIQFEKDRKKFKFQASVKNKSAPSFVVMLRDNDFITEPFVDDVIAKQAKQKVRELVNDKIFDRF